MKLRIKRTCRRTLTVLVFAVALTVITFTLPLATDLKYAKATSSATNPVCFVSRGKQGVIKLPRAADPNFLTAQWQYLHALFSDMRPEPERIDRPIHKGLPSQEDLGSFFTLTDTHANITRHAHKKLLARLPSYPHKTFFGRGVVVLAGARYSDYAATTLGMLRETGSRLPVEVWSKDEIEENQEWCKELAQDGMACRRLSDYLNVTELRNAYQWKVFTILFSSFEEILFLDADSIPIKNPDSVFDSAIYRENGVILWPDYWKHTGSPWLPYLIGINSQKSSAMLSNEMSVESGQIYWNKKTHWKSLVLATYYNFFGPEFWFTIFNNGWAGWGDKDTFPMACKAAGQSYFQVTHDIVTVFISGTTHGIGMVQADPTIESEHMPMFLHSNIIKWGLKELLCTEDCEKVKEQDGHLYMLDEDSPIKKHLQDHQRIFGVSELFGRNIDPEPMLWRVLERTACRSTRGNAHLCRNVRVHMEEAFGYRFCGNAVDDCGNIQEVCLRGPWYGSSRAKRKPETWTSDSKFADTF